LSEPGPRCRRAARARYRYLRPAAAAHGARHPSISPYGPFKVADGAVFFGIQNAAVEADGQEPVI
jgi:hypothetical protein